VASFALLVVVGFAILYTTKVGDDGGDGGE
jgi:hypothetical protein